MTSRRLVLPDSAHLSDVGGGRLCAPSAERNFEPILERLAPLVPEGGAALEIASGTGQQIARFAARFPCTDWQPSDADRGRLASIGAWREWSGLPNLRAPVPLDAAARWPGELAGFGLVFVVNLFHLVSAADARSVVRGMAGALGPGGHAFVYGPFKENGCYRSRGDAAFDRSLRAQDTEIGYKDAGWMERMLSEAGLRIGARHEMPANNLVLVARKP